MRFNVYREADSLLDLYKSDFQVKCIVAPISILGLIIAALVVFLRHKELWQLGVLFLCFALVCLIAFIFYVKYMRKRIKELEKKKNYGRKKNF